MGKPTLKSGYIVDNQNNKIDCFVKNLDWKNTPSEIEYKLDQNSNDIKTGNVNTIKEFGIGSSIVYSRHDVDIDKSSSELRDMSLSPEPEFENETLFLRLLVKGKANLYYYSEDKIYRFFYNLDDNEIEQLVYKKYLVDQSKVTTNKQYIGQLFDHLKCNDLTINDFKNLDYQRKDMIGIVSKYNACHGDDGQLYIDPESK